MIQRRYTVERLSKAQYLISDKRSGLRGLFNHDGSGLSLDLAYLLPIQTARELIAKKD